MKFFKINLIAFLSLYFLPLTAQQSTSAEAFLGYKLGERFTFHHEVVNYFRHAATVSPRVRLQEYGKSSEGRPLFVAFVSSPENIAKLEQHQAANLKAAAGDKTANGTQKPIIWLSYNIHGDEAAATEAAIATLDTLLSDDATIKKWLDSVIVVLDPCQNPDGHERYAVWVNQAGSNPANSDVNSWEHHQPWPGGRFSHYLFDLNRDWVWQTQSESRQRVALYHRWKPHVHADFHEMGRHQSYFFAPAAEPMHEALTDWQREFQVHVSENHARYFDAAGWLYYTKEIFDLLYPSYGDTYPIFNGAVAFTYEQAGSGQAGVVVEQETGLSLTLKARLEHHKTIGLSTIETAFNFQKQLLQAFNQYFEDARANKFGTYNTFIVKNEDATKVAALCELLDRQQISYGFALEKSKKYTGFDFFQRKNVTFSLDKQDIVITAKQSQSNLLRVLFEPETKLQDSLTYDLTAWALPYAFGVQTYALLEEIPTSASLPSVTEVQVQEYILGYAAPWKTLEDVQFLTAVLDAKIRVRVAYEPFRIDGQDFERGTLLISRADNPNIDLTEALNPIFERLNYRRGNPFRTGLAEQGNDLGSNSVTYLKPPRVALLSGSGASPTAVGEVWHFFEKRIGYPVSVLHTEYFRQIDLAFYDVLILCEGRYSGLAVNGKLLSFVRGGGRLICIGNASQLFSSDRDTQFGKSMVAARNYEEFSAPPTALKRYADRERTEISNTVAGSIYKIKLDPTHPLAFGYDTTTYLIKQNNSVYPLLSDNAWNVGMFEADCHVSGFVGAQLKPKIPQTLAIGIEKIGSGSIVYFSDSPIFRGFWYNGNNLLANAVFFR